ncbi:hypothetical protein [Flammeovirga aprica]|uniref:Uncharacterized protein n=1 Tax=Flammeovirga aprica JL-4 TaxID=694437 RepID=A0A7X9P470_9BACT|nr:hypothetical protein [Flammeovirga aprica]NME68502.1 hypothetical protein [Flammeovirga aprica JL-4]
MRVLLLIIIDFMMVQCKTSENFAVTKQKKFKYSCQLFCDSLNIRRPDFSTVDLEIRVWYGLLHSGDHSFLKIQRIKDGSWRGESTQFNFYGPSHFDFNSQFRAITFTRNWSNTWEEIVAKDYLNLPTQDDVDKRIIEKHSFKQTVFFGDGNYYIIEALTKNAKRKIIYSNPELYSEQYLKQGINSVDYSAFFNFISLLNDEFKFKKKLVN